VNLKASLIGAALAISAVATASPAFAWSELGVRNVMDRTDHDVINLPGNRRFDRIKLCVYRNPIRFYDLQVHYRNGGTQDVSVRNFIGAGQCTRSIDLNGDDRNIDRISMTYEETSWRRRTATVRVFGE
jgi:hypothetical protein